MKTVDMKAKLNLRRHRLRRPFVTSRFSYIKSKEKYLVCALKGVHDEEKNLMLFSDPVIHHIDSKSLDHRCGHCRIDRGRKGIKDFFNTRSCEEQGYLCKLLTEKEKVEQFIVICD